MGEQGITPGPWTRMGRVVGSESGSCWEIVADCSFDENIIFAEGYSQAALSRLHGAGACGTGEGQ